MTSDTHYVSDDYTYIWNTPEGHYSLTPDPDDPDYLFVRALSEEDGGWDDDLDLSDFMSTLELAGVAEGEDFSNLTTFEDQKGRTTLRISKPTLVLFLQFDILNYMGVTND